MARRVFFSFHYQRDIWRVNQIRNVPNVIGTAAAGFTDASLWEEAKEKGDSTIKRMIRDALKNTSVTVVCIGEKTAGRQCIDYEIEQSLDRGNGLVGIRIHHLEDHNGDTDEAGPVPPEIEEAGFSVYKFVSLKKLAERIEEAAEIAGR